MGEYFGNSKPPTMHVEIKVAQNFILDFLFNKLPRRRVNLFGEELEAALRDKFSDHWYPDKPFKGSAFRCLKITDPADPVLNRAARESGNPIPDITENLPTDLAIWIDPGEVSYRIGEKGSVKILYSANDPSNFPIGGAGCSTNSNSVNEELSNEPTNLQMSSNVGNSGFLPIENLNSAMNALSVNTAPAPVIQAPRPLINPQFNHHGNDQGPLQPPQPNLGNNINLPIPPIMNPSSNNCGGGSVNTSNNVMLPNTNATSPSGFTPFPPRQQQQVTYTAGSFAQTKFGSTKLKSCGKKTNRMSPTEFSNYIKQRAMQKQGTGSASTTGGNMNTAGGMNSFGGMVNGGNVAVGGNQFRTPMSSNGGQVNGMSNGRPITSNGFYGNSQQHHPNFNAFNGGLADAGRIQQQMNVNHNHSNSQPQTSPDSFFYPLFPDRGRQQNQAQSNQPMGNQNNLSSMMNSSALQMGQTSPSLFQQGGNATGSVSSGGSSTGSSSASSTSSNNPWSYADTDTETFLQDILSMGLSSSKQGRNMYSELSVNGEGHNFPIGSNSSSHVFGSNNSSGGHSNSLNNTGTSNSLGLSGNFGNFGNMNSGNSNNSLIGGGSFGGLMEENGTGSNNKMMDRLGSASMSQGNSSQQAVGTGNTEKYPHRVMVAN